MQVLLLYIYIYIYLFIYLYLFLNIIVWEILGEKCFEHLPVDGQRLKSSLESP